MTHLDHRSLSVSLSSLAVAPRRVLMLGLCIAVASLMGCKSETSPTAGASSNTGTAPTAKSAPAEPVVPPQVHSAQWKDNKLSISGKVSNQEMMRDMRAVFKEAGIEWQLDLETDPKATENYHVTLKGKAANAAERDKLVKLVTQAYGKVKVDDQMSLP